MVEKKIQVQRETMEIVEHNKITPTAFLTIPQAGLKIKITKGALRTPPGTAALKAAGLRISQRITR